MEVWSPRLGDFHDVAVAVEVARVDLGGAFLAGLAAVRVVGAGHVDLAGVQARLDVLAAVHLGGSDLVSGQAGVDQDFLDGHARDHRLAADHQRQPLAGAVEGAVGGELARAVDLRGRGVAGELGNVEVPGGEQGHVVLAVAFAVLLRGDELVEVVEALVVAHVGHDVAGLGHDDVGALRA